jgi:DNA-binding FrmR family transcriptional regulator
MNMPEAVVGDAVARLRRVEGQVAGVIRMIETQRECRDVVMQISAASKALEQVGFKLLASGLRYCVADPEAAREAGYSEAEFERLFLKLA